MVTWFLGTPSPELHEIIWELTETARQACLVIEAQFLDNSESCVLRLDARFCAFKQGDLSISDYCHRMKGMADDLRAMGEGNISGTHGTLVHMVHILNLIHQS
jgi:hypothetical protein